MTEPKTTAMNRTAILVIHGIGEQMPLETLDSFTKGLTAELRKVTGASKQIFLHHQTKPYKDNHGEWFDSYIHLKQNDNSNLIDVYEYFWAHLTEKEISLEEIDVWLNTTLKGSKDFFQEDEELQKQYEQDHKEYSRKLSQLLKHGLWLYRGIKFMVKILGRFLGRFGWFQLITEYLQLEGGKLMIDYVGDVAIYTTTDIKSKHFKIRQQIIANATQRLQSLLDSKEYHQIIIAGHSLGSVISYDVLNQLNLFANHNPALQDTAKQKIKCLFTFGSPLDKIAFFFRERASKSEYIRRQILSHLRSFKARNLDLKKYPENEIVTNEIKSYVDHVEWFNYYHKDDPVSGHLDYYNDVKNVECTFQNEKSNTWGIAHLGYWQHAPMYEKIIEKVFETKSKNTDT